MNDTPQCITACGLTIHTANGPLHGQLHLASTPRASLLLVHTPNSAVDHLATDNLAAYGYNILSMDLLTVQEAQFADAAENIPRLTQRVIDLLDFARRDANLAQRPLGILATGNACPAALRATARRDTQLLALACHNGLIDRAGKESLELLVAPLLTLSDVHDSLVESSYERARPHLTAPHEFHQLAPSENPVPHMASWFSAHLGR
jgi:hypothetical protein